MGRASSIAILALTGGAVAWTAAAQTVPGDLTTPAQGADITSPIQGINEGQVVAAQEAQAERLAAAEQAAADRQAAIAAEPSSSVVSVTVSQSIEADSNYDLDEDSPGTTYLGDTGLDLTLEQSTQTHNLLLGFNTALRALDQAGEDFEFTLGSPTGGLLDYTYEGPGGTLFDARLSYLQRRADFTEFDILDTPGLEGDPITIRNEDDTRERRLDAEVGADFFTDSPSSYGLRWIGSDISYSDDVANLTPRRSNRISGSWTLRLTPVLSSIVAAEYYHYTAENNADTELTISEIDAGVVYEPDENLRLRGGIGYADRQRDETNANGVRRTTQDDQGPTLRGDVRYLTDDFTLTGDARYTTAAPDPRLDLNFNANYALARGTLTGRLFNRYTGATDNGNEIRVAGFSVGFEQGINTTSSYGLDLAVANRESLDNENDPDTLSTSVTARYMYELTETVTAELGYRYRAQNEDDPGFDADSHRVFFSIGKTFQTGL